MRERPPSNAPTPESISAGHETSDINLRPILVSAAWLVAITIAVQLILWGAMKLFEAGAERTDSPPSPVAAFRQEPPDPRLQPLFGLHNTTPAQDWQIMKRENERALKTFGWVDRDRGIARIPIDQAMKLLVERGLPSRDAAATTQGANR